MKRILLITAGFLSIGLGIIGVFVPLLPTTAFMLLAAWLFSKSSPSWRAWLINHPWLGKHIRNYTQHRGITPKARTRAITMLWITLLVSAVVTGGKWWILLILFTVGVGVTWHLLALKTVSNLSTKVNPDDYVEHDQHRPNVA